MLGSYERTAVCSAERPRTAPLLITAIGCPGSGGIGSYASETAGKSCFDERQLVVLVERRWRGQGPLQRCGARAPWIVGGLLLAHERLGHAEEEDERPKSRDIGAIGGHQVPAGE